MLYIGIDLGGTGIKAGVVNENGEIIAKASCPTGVERGYGPVIEDMAKLCIKAAEQAGVSESKYLKMVYGNGTDRAAVEDYYKKEA